MIGTNFNAIAFLKERLVEAQKAFEEEKARFAKAQAAWQSANNLVLACQRLLDEEQHRQQGSAPTPEPTDDVAENKTDLVRNALREHASGMTPGELWSAVSGQIAHRPYLYSILKRLKDKSQVAKRRGKYYLVEPPEERELPLGDKVSPQ
jgi:hypothetical protein